MSMSEDRSAERRWIVLSEDGRFVTLGRVSDPSEQEIRDAEVALVKQGLAGWLAVMQGNPYVGHEPRLMEVHALGQPSMSWDAAAKACVQAIMKRRSDVGG